MHRSPFISLLLFLTALSAVSVQASEQETSEKLQMAILVSGSGTNMDNILKSASLGQLRHIEPRIVIANQKKGRDEALPKTTKYSPLLNDWRLTAQYIPSWKIDNDTHAQQIIDALESNGVTPENGIIVLAGYMKILQSQIIKKFGTKRILNIHPSRLNHPGSESKTEDFKGADAIKNAWQAYIDSGKDKKKSISGVTVHHVTDGMDEGEHILQATIDMSEYNSLEEYEEQVHATEYIIYPAAIQLVAKQLLKK